MQNSVTRKPLKKKAQNKTQADYLLHTSETVFTEIKTD